MASARRWYWLLGIAAGGLLAAGAALGLPVGGVLVVGGTVVLFAVLIRELIGAVRFVRSIRPVEPPPGAQPADGRVDRLVVAGAWGEPNAVDPRFSAFRGLEPMEAAAPTPAPSLSRSAATPPPLLGRIALVSLFIGRDGRSWSDQEIAESHAALTRVGEWIEREAMRWDAPVNIALADTYFVVEDEEERDVELMFVAVGTEVGPFEAHATTRALTDSSRAAAQLGFRDAVDWMGEIRRRLDVDALVWLVHPRQAGRSFAVPLDLTELPGVSLAVCYARGSNLPEPLRRRLPYTDAATVVHELFHLFGASDKYGVELRSFPPRTVSSRDVMRLNEMRLSWLRVDPLTALEVGWNRTRSTSSPGAERGKRHDRPESSDSGRSCSMDQRNEERRTSPQLDSTEGRDFAS